MSAGIIDKAELATIMQQLCIGKIDPKWLEDNKEALDAFGEEHITEIETNHGTIAVIEGR